MFISSHLIRTCVEVGIPPCQKLSDWVGTGILYGDCFAQDIATQGRYSHCYLFTNRHIMEELQQRNAREVAIRLLNKKTGRSIIHLSSLYKDEQALFAVHPNIEVDVAALWMMPASDLELEFELTGDSEIMWLDTMENEGISEGDGVFVVGYPYSILGLTPGETAYPIIRSGCISRIANAYSRFSETYLIDVTVYPGNSGGPVICKPSSPLEHLAGTKGTNKSALIGMVNKYHEYFDEAISSQTNRPRVTFVENSGITVVETVDNMMMTLELLKERIASHLYTPLQPSAADAIRVIPLI